MFLSESGDHKRMLKFLLFLNLMMPVRTFADAKYFVVTLPVVTFGREGAIRAECNLFQKGTLALEWTEWVGKGKREELTNKEMKVNPHSSLLSEGRELSMMFGRYTDPFNMGGFHWGLGAGYRFMKAEWTRTSSTNTRDTQYTPSLYHIKAAGPTLTGRIGYRFVGDNIGFAIGSFLGVKHYINQVTDDSDQDSTKYSHIGLKDRNYLQKKFATSLKIGIEIGWAF